MMIIEIPRKLANLHGQVSELLAARILSGAYPPETALPTEAELCQAYGVSRTTLREAIKNLVAKGFLEVAPSRGTWVRPMRAWNLLDEEVLRWRVALGINAKLVQDIYEMRECFEPRATAFTAERGTAADHSAIASAFEEMKLSRDEGGLVSAEADVAFHTAILLGSGNDFLISFSNMIETALRVSFQVARSAKTLSDHDLAQHEKVLNAILSRDADAAYRASEELLLESKAFLVQVVASMKARRRKRT